MSKTSDPRSRRKVPSISESKSSLDIQPKSSLQNSDHSNEIDDLISQALSYEIPKKPKAGFMDNFAQIESVEKQKETVMGHFELIDFLPTDQECNPFQKVDTTL